LEQPGCREGAHRETSPPSVSGAGRGGCRRSGLSKLIAEETEKWGKVVRAAIRARVIPRGMKRNFQTLSFSPAPERL
jgi:hypothetical protein